MDEQKAWSCLTPPPCLPLRLYQVCLLSHVSPTNSHVRTSVTALVSLVRMGAQLQIPSFAGSRGFLMVSHACLRPTVGDHCAFVKKYLSRSLFTGCSHAVRNTRLLLTVKTDIINTMQESGFLQLIQILIRPPGEAGWLANPRSIK